MKFLIVASILGLIALGAQAQTFSDELRQFNDQFNEYHRDIDYFLRFERMNTSDIMEAQNRMALTSIWDVVLNLKLNTEVANDRLIYVALEIGNQEPCIVDLFNELRETEVRAGQNISACATAMHNSQENAINGGFFNTVDYTQRSSHFLQIITLYTLGLYNTVTEQTAIRNELNTIWEERENIRSEERIVDEQYWIMVALQTARINLNNCMAVIDSVYRQETEAIATAAEACRTKRH